ncbi:MAG TPA: hypothetical protein VG013_22985, partial [Gemmataceae bacterium]|nr:hypothetical protein [Gemmataceae bacterium]
MRQHHALGVAGRAGGIHDGGQVIGPQGLFPPRQLRRRPGECLAAALQEPVPRQGVCPRRTTVEDDDPPQLRQAAAG